jgi:hypothetical protein
MAGPVPKMKVADTAASTKLSLPQQYARVSARCVRGQPSLCVQRVRVCRDVRRRYMSRQRAVHVMSAFVRRHRTEGQERDGADGNKCWAC